MPRHRTDNSRMVYIFPADFPERLLRFKEESGLTWAEIARRVGTSDLNLRRWREGVRPHWRHLAGRCWNWPKSWAWPTCSPTGRSGRNLGVIRPPRTFPDGT